eukprot:TRINITY_DN33749_c0_g3_i1.p1 TRINITY_DN33749_c0_g3~~TRINITY_DN33749_c0_g3_i1.p1  ORF type:complete len:425 (-),score=68.46 TRINITY_DN33749_c0_g3_i1:80-1354(-)
MDPSDLPNPCPSKVAAATMAIVKNGQYRLASESKDCTLQVKLEPQGRLKSAGRAAKTLRTPHSSLPPPPPPQTELPPDNGESCMRITLFEGTSFEAASWLMESGISRTEPCVLDFASDSEPGGGWKGKQRGTQEEGLCRSSNLGICLEEHYENVGAAAFMPHLSVVYCPDIVVFRSCRSQRLLEKPFWVGVAAAALRSTGSDADIRDKVDGVLHVAGNHGHKQVVLGAWGCGAFGNDPDKIAGHMLTASLECRAWFDHVVFAVPHGDNFDAFQAKLHGTCDVVGLSSTLTDTLAPPIARLTEQHKWELLAAVPECMQDVAEHAVTLPEDCKTQERARRCAATLLTALKAACIVELAKENSPDLVARLHQILPPGPSAADDQDARAAELTEAEEQICAAFQDASRDLVMELIKTQRRSLQKRLQL